MQELFLYNIMIMEITTTLLIYLKVLMHKTRRINKKWQFQYQGPAKLPSATEKAICQDTF